MLIFDFLLSRFKVYWKIKFIVFLLTHRIFNKFFIFKKNCTIYEILTDIISSIAQIIGIRLFIILFIR